MLRRSFRSELLGGLTIECPDVQQTYDTASILALVATLLELFAHHTRATFLLSATLRNEATFDTFKNACGKALRTAVKEVKSLNADEASQK